MSVLTINAFPSNSYVTVVYNSETTVGMVPFTMEIETGSTIQYKVEALQCTPDPDPSKGSEYKTLLVDEDKTLSVILNYIGAVQPDTWVPALGNETFPTHIAMLGKGGWRSVESNDERDAIPSARREAGMSVYVTSTNKVYILDDDLVTWNELESGKVDDVRLHNVSVVDSKIANLETVRQVTTLPVEPLIAGEIVQYIGNTNANYTNGYFYKQTSRNTTYSNVAFESMGDYTIDVTVTDEDFSAWINSQNQTPFPIERGQIGYRSGDPLSYSGEGLDKNNRFFLTIKTATEFGEAGFTFDPIIGPSQGVKYTVENITTWVWEQVNVQPETDLVWGNITGTLSDQTDLQEALDAKQDTLTAGTNITIEEDAQTGDLVISSKAQESFYRGRFNSWNSVPVNESGYLPEPGTQDQKTPTNNDFIVIIDPSDYASPEFTENFTFTGFNDPELGYGVSWTYLNVTYKVYGNDVVFGPGDCLRLNPSNGGLRALRTTIVDGTPLYPNSGIRWLGGGEHSASATGSPGDYTGTWRFYYNGDWATDGKLGWFPQYQIENTLPIASPTEPGITKLYNTTGSNTDGAVDQNTVTSELGKRVLQVTEFPEASASNKGQLVQFIGTDGSGTTGWFYTSTQYQIPYSLTVEGDSDVTVTTYNTETYLSQLSDTTVDSTTVFTYDGTNWKDSDSNVVDLTDWGITISGTPVNNSTITGTYVAPSTGYRWVQTDTQPTEEYHESFFRGPFGTWANVPGVGHEDQYYADFYGNHRPGLTDYIVVANPEDYVSEETEVIHLTTTSTGGSTASMNVTILSTGQTEPYLYHDPGSQALQWKSIPDTDFYIAYGITETSGNWGIKNISSPFTVDGRVYPVGSVYTWAYNVTLDKPVNSYPVYRGMWRFAYTSNSWDSEGKNGWKPEYQIENVLPIADSQTLGIAKLYTTTGTHTDGSVTQKLVTDELGKKQDTLTEGTGISIDENNVISATFSESYFRGKFSTWNTVPTDYRNYYPDYTGSTKPTRTDYMVVEDPSGYVKPGTPIEIYQLPLVGGTAYIKIVMNGQEYTFNHNDVSQNPKTFGIEGHRLYLTYTTPIWYITPLDIPVIVDGIEKPINEVAYSWDYNRGSSEYLQKTINFIGQGGYEGTWRFSYQSDDWDTSGKNGWEPEYQIEDVLPIATDTDAGIMKLYTTTGSNTDGTMDQSSITIELETLDTNKQDVLTNASNAGEGIIIDDVTQEISTNNIVWRKW